MFLRFTVAWLIAWPCAAGAQFVPPPPAGDRIPGILERADRVTAPATGASVADVRHRIGQDRKSGALSKGAARGLRREADQVDTLRDRYAADGLSYSERREIDMRVQALDSLRSAQRGPGAKR